MKRKFYRVYQFRITLVAVMPPIWCRIQVPETYTFWDLHVAIQDAMGWTDSHLHLFEIRNSENGLDEIGIPDEENLYDDRILAGWELKIADYFSPENKKANYIYDFGDNWQHTVILEKILPRETGVKYPICIDGARACPPEDCGGPWRYEEFLKAIKNPNHKRHEELLNWIGGHFDPEDFDVKDVVFDNPKERIKNLYY